MDQPVLFSDELSEPEAEIYCDGASSGNPGQSGIGVLIRFRKNSPALPDIRISESIGITTNNVAEYSAFIRALKEAASAGLRRIEIYLDSELIVKQIKGVYKVRSANLRPLWEEALKMLKKFDSYKLAHVRRDLNMEADLLAKGAVKNAGKS
ncbi:MAG TPA: ribonuclease HI family protein [Nitrospirae bacterium]|nr:ribonuclease HI family protein [Nitrospirota bacterium]